MQERVITPESMRDYKNYLAAEEKSEATIAKYLRDLAAFAAYAGAAALTKETVIAYKQRLIEESYAIRSINSMLASLNSFFAFSGWSDLRVKALKLQMQPFCPEERELTREEYERLCRVAQKKQNNRLCLILQTICSTGIRVSELAFITAEAVQRGKACVSAKGKTRVILLPAALQKKLQSYLRQQHITTGCVFTTRSGRPVSRFTVWREMKSLCAEAQVDPCKVFPHNLRHLFARVFYAMEKDIAKLADVLGHSSINTTRIYIITTGREHRRCMEKMHLII